jgi:hypothetical protein
LWPLRSQRASNFATDCAFLGATRSCALLTA